MDRSQHRTGGHPAALGPPAGSDEAAETQGGGGVTRSRKRIVLAVPVVVVVGMMLRFGLPGDLADPLGGFFYALLMYLLVAFIAPRQSSVAIGGIALGVCVAIELFQLTTVPARLADIAPALALIFGTGFSFADLPPYSVGAAGGILLDRLLRIRMIPTGMIHTGSRA